MSNDYYCKLCLFEATNNQDFEDHKSTDVHRTNYLKYRFQREKEGMIANKNSVVISCVEYLKCTPTLEIRTFLGNSATVHFSIENKGTNNILFIQCQFLHKLPCQFSLQDYYKVTDGSKALRILEGEMYHVKLEINPTDIGIYAAPLVFHFSIENEEKPFYIMRYIELNCYNELSHSLQPREEYDGSNLETWSPPAKDIIPAPYRKIVNKPKGKFKLENVTEPAMKVVKELQRKYYSESGTFGGLSKEPQKLLNILREGLNRITYQEYFKILFRLEEVQMDYDIRKYDMLNVQLRSFSSVIFELEVPGLAENRPSVMLGDYIYVRIVAEKLEGIDREYEGKVIAITETKVQLEFSPKFHGVHISGMKIDVRFSYNKLPLKTIHRALIDLSYNQIAPIFFPGEDPESKSYKNGFKPVGGLIITKQYESSDSSQIVYPSTCPPLFYPSETLCFYNREIERNPQQAAAVKHIVAGSSLPAPYLVHGPPGTGKTVTIVEAIKQVWKRFPEAYILVCTPSNSAADLVVEKLLDHVTKGHILRFYSASREEKKIPEKIKEAKCCNFNFDEHIPTYPELTDILRFRIVASTLINSGKLVSLGVEKGHFTHIFVDESGHSTEPEIVIPVSGLLKVRSPGSPGFGGQLVLSGDPLQLGPVIRCKVAELFGLSMSLLERLMTNCHIYHKVDGQFNPKVLTRLLRNYRSHPAILKLPNDIFYDGDLQCFADVLQRESLSQWEGLPNPGFPVLFHGILGKDVREGKSPSYYNAQEVSVVIDYVKKLLSVRHMGMNIQEQHIGIITPYRQQVYKIRQELLRKNIRKIAVGSVDEFQGQERRVIIISTVRSSYDLMQYDSQFKLGFVRMPKRFNVSITRAKCLLIIIGNPKLLSTDTQCWDKMLRYCHVDHFSYVGVFYDMKEDAARDMLDRCAQLDLIPNSYNMIGPSPRAQQEDPEWRDDY